jgi:protein ImuB
LEIRHPSIAALRRRVRRNLALGAIALSPRRAPTLQGALELKAGPERIEAGWWDGEEVRRDYYVAANARGETFWIYREHRDASAWYLHGVFA